MAENDVYTMGVGIYGAFFTSIASIEFLKMLKPANAILLYDYSSFNPFILNILEYLSRGRLKNLLKHIWAYYFSIKLSKIVQSVKTKLT
jgi:hypothetical protein